MQSGLVRKEGRRNYGWQPHVVCSTSNLITARFEEQEKEEEEEEEKEEEEEREEEKKEEEEKKKSSKRKNKSCGNHRNLEHALKYIAFSFFGNNKHFRDTFTTAASLFLRKGEGRGGNAGNVPP